MNDGSSVAYMNTLQREKSNRTDEKYQMCFICLEKICFVGLGHPTT